MSAKLITLAERRQKLILKAAAQRQLLARDIAPLDKPLTIAYRGFQIVRYVRQHPILMLGVTSVISIIRPSRLQRWIKASVAALSLARNVSNMFIKK